jgi:hypothetical protein
LIPAHLQVYDLSWSRRLSVALPFSTSEEPKLAPSDSEFCEKTYLRNQNLQNQNELQQLHWHF